MAVWKCNKCGHTLDKQVPPEICPSCNQGCEFIDVSCYTPECGGPDSGNIDPKVFTQSSKSGK